MDIDRFILGFCTLDLRLQLILQWSTGILVLILCFLKRKQFATDISSKLGSSFTVVPFIIVVVSIFTPLCTSLSFYTTNLVVVNRTERLIHLMELQMCCPTPVVNLTENRIISSLIS